jgi:hypothetical protein
MHPTSWIALPFSTLGGQGGSGGTSDRVQVEHSGLIRTLGDFGQGVFAQSVARGGGSGGFGDADTGVYQARTRLRSRAPWRSAAMAGRAGTPVRLRSTTISVAS